jgi:hypothetical protein
MEQWSDGVAQGGKPRFANTPSPRRSVNPPHQLMFQDEAPDTAPDTPTLGTPHPALGSRGPMPHTRRNNK